MKKKHIIFIIIIVAIILAGIIGYVVKNGKDEANNSIDLYTIPTREKVFVNGIIIPEQTESIYKDETKGSINKVAVTDGQIVKKGDALFTYKNDLITDQIDEANRLITSNNNQIKKLQDKQAQAKKQLANQQEEAKQQATQIGVDSASMGESITAGTEAQIDGYTEQIDVVQTQIDTSTDQVKNLKNKEFTNITAPIDGKVIISDPKDMTKPYMVIEATTFYVKGSINEKDQTKLMTDQEVDILLYAIDKTITGKVKSIGNSPAVADVAASAQSAIGGSSSMSYYDVDISLDSQEGVVNGFHVQATVKLKEEQIKIPKTSIVEEDGKKYVFKVVSKVLKKVEITYEDSTEDEVIVISGLKENDKIAVTAKEMKEGSAVE